VVEMEKKGQLQIWYNSSVKEIHPDKVLVQKEKEVVELPNDFIFIFAGAEMPHKFLMSLGIQIDKKFGEALS
jgi:thioredoxin reductase (NADPH)